MRLKSLVLAAGVAFSAALPLSAMSQPAVTVQLKPQDQYVRPFPPFHIVGNLYYVGTYDLAVYLITTPQGHLLINTGVNDSASVIKANVEKIGFRFADIKLLLATHGHWDHVGAFADIKRMTGAP